MRTARRRQAGSTVRGVLRLPFGAEPIRLRSLGPALVTLGEGFRGVLDAERQLLPDDVYGVGSMLSHDERLLLHWAARTAGPGAVVDLGAFLGGSALALASGAQHGDETVYSYDRFVLSADWERTWLPDDIVIALGGSTRAVFDRNTRRVRDRVVARNGDVETYPWEDGPIAVLFIDIAKTWRTADFVWRTFLPWLRPGSVLIQQDLVHWGHPWCAIIMEHLVDHFDYLGWVWYSSAVYRCTSAITPPDRLLDALSCDEMVTLVDRAADRLGSPASSSVRLSAAVVYATFDRFEEARARVDEIRALEDNQRLPYIEEGFAYLGRWIAEVESGAKSAR